MDICLQNHELALAVKRTFGSWRQAMIALELISDTNPPVRSRKWDSQRVLESIRLRHREGKPLHYKAIHVDANPLICAARHYFGSWRNALAAAGVEPEQPARGRPAKTG
jgi:hypothetical protein